MANATLKPVEGRRVLNHNQSMRPLDPNGEPVVMDAVWRKRLAEGDVVVVPDAEPARAHKASKATS
jgi:hypothetical protein